MPQPFTVVDVDSGVAASLTVVPGTLQPRWEDGRWVADLRPLVAQLADQVGVAYLSQTYHPNGDSADGWPEGFLRLLLPVGWRPDLDLDERLAGEATAILSLAKVHSWWVWFGRRQALQVDVDVRFQYLSE